MNFKDFYLTEHTNALYHATSLHKFASMIKDNAIKLTMSSGSDATINQGKYYYLSAMRVKYGKYAGGSDVSYDTIIDLNGTSISHVARIRGVDYWGKEFSSSKTFREEQEERIMMDKPELAPMSKYVNSVHVYLAERYLDNPSGLQLLSYLNETAPKTGLKVYYYSKGNETAFRMQRTERAIMDLSEFLSSYNLDDVYYMVYKRDDGTEFIGNHPMTKNQALRVSEKDNRFIHKDEVEASGFTVDHSNDSLYDSELLVDFLHLYRNEPTEFKNKYSLASEVGYYGFINSIDSDIHNAKFKHRPILREYVKEMKKAKMRNLTEFLKFAIAKIIKDHK